MLAALCFVLSITAFLPLLPVNWWWVRIGDFPRVQLLIAYVLALAALLVFMGDTTFGRVLMLAMGGGIAIQLFWIFPYLPVAPKEVQWASQSVKDVRLRILSANVLQDNREIQPLLKLVESEKPDIVVVCEVDQYWVEHLAPLEKTHPHFVLHPLENTYGLALYSKLELQNPQVRAMLTTEIPSIDAMVLLPDGHQVRLFAVHPNPPRPGEDTTKRDGELVLVGREVCDDPSAIVLGDLNDVGWSRTTNLFQKVSGLLDPRKGRGLYPTFNANSYVWRYPLDYLFHSDDFRVADLRTLPHIGSDHLPLLVELSREPAARALQETPELNEQERKDAQKAVREAKALDELDV